MKTNELFSAGALLFYALVGLLIYSGVRLVRSLRSVPSRPNDPYTNPHTMGARLIRDDFGYLLEHYRRLDFDAHEKVRLPLNPASWPGFGEKWDYPQVELFSLRIMMAWSLLKAKVVWKEMGWPESVSRLFRCGESTVMVDVLVGLQECIDWLKQQIEKPNGRYTTWQDQPFNDYWPSPNYHRSLNCLARSSSSKCLLTVSSKSATNSFTL